jgi:hypothetical protein
MRTMLNVARPPFCRHKFLGDIKGLNPFQSRIKAPFLLASLACILYPI